MSFELLDDILLESKETTKDDKSKDKEETKEEEKKEEKSEGKEETKEEEAKEETKEEMKENTEYIGNLIETMENVLYSDLDQLIENSMRVLLRTVITESSIPSDVKVNQLSIVEKAIFTKEQMEKFVNENIHPILDCAGVFQGTYNLGGTSPIAVSLPIYEAALILHIANEGLLKSISKEDEKPIIKNSLYESMMESKEQDEVDEQKSMEIVNEHLSLLYSRYEIEDDNDREKILGEAINMINKYGIDNIRPSFYEIAECVCEYNKNAEIKDEKLFGEVVPETPELSESDNIFVSALNRMKTKLNGLISTSLKNKFKNVSEQKSINEDSHVISIATVATGLSAMVALRETKTQCENYECLQSAFQGAINTIKAQSTICENSKNKKMCELCNKKLEEKWNLTTELNIKK